MVTDRLILRQPDDWHVHLRDGAMLANVVDHTARQFARAIVMPNLVPPVIDRAGGRAYRERIRAALPPGRDFTPLMTCYLTDGSDADEIALGFAEGLFTACKLYPAHATTNSSHGVTDLRRLTRVLERMQDIGMPLLLHGEVTDPSVDIFDREAVFIDRVLVGLVRDFPALKIVMEHITTAQAADFVAAAGTNLAATVTPHHLTINRNAMFERGLRPHFYCLPVAKRERHRLALRRAVISGSGKFFLGTDSAPHAIPAKTSACGCAGIFNAPYALESYAQCFEEEGALAQFQAFAAENGPRFYGLAPNPKSVLLERRAVMVPEQLGEGPDALVPFHAGEQLPWRFIGVVDHSS